jgi:hypothetical protein
MRKTLVFASLALGSAAMAAQLVPADGHFPTALRRQQDLSRQGFINEPAQSAAPKDVTPARVDDPVYDYETVVVGTSRYDYQHNGSYGKMIAVSPDGVNHGSFMGGINITTGRRVQAWCVGQDLGLTPAADVSAVRTGYTTHATTSANPGNGLVGNSGVVGFHSATGSWFGVDFSGCTMAFNLLQEDESIDILWPHIVVDYQDKIHMVCGDGGTVTADAVWYTASTDGLAWDGNYVMVTDNSNTLSETAAAAKNAPGAAIFYMPNAPASPVFYDTGAPQWHHDLLYYEARDADNDLFAQIADGNPVNITNYNSTASTAPFRSSVYAYADVDAIYDTQETPNLLVAFPTPVSMMDSMLYEDLSDNTTYYTEFVNVDPWHSAVWFYNATSQEWGHIGGWLTADDETGAAVTGQYVGVFRNAQDRVQLAHDPETGNLYALWNVYSLHDLRGPGADSKLMGNGELYLACSADGGLTWGPRVNITNSQTPGCDSPNCHSETFGSMAEIVDNGYLHITFMMDQHAGSSIRNTDTNDGSVETVNNYYYMRVPVASVPPHAGTPWNADGHIGLSAYSRQWYFTAGHPDTLRMIDRVNIFNEGPTPKRLVDLTMYHDDLDVFGAPESNLWVTWEVMQGDAVEPGEWIVDPATEVEWDGILAAQSNTLTHLSVGHRGLPLREQAFKFTFDDGTERVYRFIYQPADGGDPLVAEIDIENLGQYAHTTLYHSDAVAQPTTPVDFALSQNVPNPFNPATEISFEMVSAGNVSLKVFNLMGETVATLVNGPMSAGNHTVSFNGSQLSSGVYFYTLEAAGKSETRKMLLTK